MGLKVNGETPLSVRYYENGTYKGEVGSIVYEGNVIWPLGYIEATLPFLCTTSGVYRFEAGSLNFTAVAGGSGGGGQIGTGAMSPGLKTTITHGATVYTANAGKSGNGKTGAGGAGGVPGGRAGGGRGASNGGAGGQGFALGGNAGPSAGNGEARWDNYPNEGGRGATTISSYGGSGYGAGGGGYGKTRELITGQFPVLQVTDGAGGGGSGGMITGTITDASGAITVTVEIGSEGNGGFTAGVRSGNGAPGAVYFA